MKTELKILLVEDEEYILEELQEFLSYRYSQVYLAKNGQEGMELFFDKKPDIILTDVTMPVMDGLQMAQKIKQHDPQMPIVLMTALNDASLFGRAINIGIDAYVGKPTRPDDIIKAIEKISHTIVLKKELAKDQKLLMEYKYAVDEGALVSKTDPKGVITYANDAFCKISGYRKEELVGQKHSIVRHPDEPASTFKQLWQTIKNKQVWKGEIKNRAKDGSTYYVSSTIVPILDENDEIVEFLGLRQDITQLEEYKQILEQSLDKSIETFNEKVFLIKEYEKAISASNAYTRGDRNGVITYVNDKFCSLCGYSREELVGKPHSMLRHPDMPKELFSQMWSRILSGQIWQGVIKNRRKDGSAFYLDTTIVPIVDMRSNIIEYMSIRYDVTELIDLHSDIEESQREIISTMGMICETRSKETGNHVKRVAEYSKLLAIEYGLCGEEAELIKHASPMHDIGKVAIPDDILNKPGKLTEEEFAVMKTHAQLGYEMLKGSNRSIIKAASTIALEHHEKWDGSGYPTGKSGEQIHIYGRITALADVFDALGSERVYKKAWELENIFDLFRQQKGRHFDPKLVDIFFEKLDSFMQIRERYKD